MIQAELKDFRLISTRYFLSKKNFQRLFCFLQEFISLLRVRTQKALKLPFLLFWDLHVMQKALQLPL